MKNILIDLSQYSIEKGAFALILINKSQNIVYKLFKSYDHPDMQCDGNEEIGKLKFNEFREKVFFTEKKAYELAQNSKILKEYTPKYYGSTIISKVIKNGIDISEQFLLNCCLKLEYIKGATIKLDTLIHSGEKYKDELKNIKREFYENNINFLLDSSAIINNTSFKVIDFATKSYCEFEPIVDM